ncbi:MAG: PHP domain-containing protein [Patescibacteria group bacterium]
MNKFDFHFHSTYSDGKLSVPELAEMIKTEKLSLCALTDHNTVDGTRELGMCLNGSGITVVPGVELSVKYDENEVHILALDFDIDRAVEILKERNELVRDQKIEEMKKAIELSRTEGLEITDGLLPVEKQPVTLTLALDICANRVNQGLFIKKHGKPLIPEDIFFEYQAPGKSCAVERSGVTAEWIVEKFKGVAQDLIIAHPFVSVSVVTKPLDEVRMKDLIRIGMTGIEMYHSKTSNEQISLIEKIVTEKGLHYTGGSDFHGRKTDPSIGQYGHDLTLPDFHLSHYEQIKTI